ncbi:MAG: tetratricopeptide repeat protein [Pirellulaceae bacterium]
MRIGDRRVRLVLAGVLIVVIGLALYQIGREVRRIALRRQVDAALAARDFAAAELALQEGLQAQPDSAELKLLAAQTARRQGKLAEALRRLRRCSTRGAMAGPVALEQRLLRLQAGDLSGGESLDRYCEEFPQSQEAALILEAQIEGSLAALDEKRALNYLAQWNERPLPPADRVQGLLWSSQAHQLAGQVAAAQADCRAAVELAPEHREARLVLAELLALGEPDEAARHLKILKERHPRDPEILLPQAQVLRTLGRLDEAAQALDELLAIEPDHVAALVERGLVALELRQNDAAGKWLHRAEQLAPKYREVLLAMIDYARATGQTAEVERYQQRMRTIEAEIRAQLKDVLKKESPPGNAPIQQPAP